MWNILALSGVLGLANAFDMPTRQAFLVDMVPTREDLPNAIALNSSLSRISPDWPVRGRHSANSGRRDPRFLFNAISYLAVIIAYAIMRDFCPHARVPPAVFEQD
ncbi:MAG: MFS transporter [Pirellulaceae bacterium]